jgi:hypothetical protein
VRVAHQKTVAFEGVPVSKILELVGLLFAAFGVASFVAVVVFMTGGPATAEYFRFMAGVFDTILMGAGWGLVMAACFIAPGMTLAWVARALRQTRHDRSHEKVEGG